MADTSVILRQTFQTRPATGFVCERLKRDFCSARYRSHGIEAKNTRQPAAFKKVSAITTKHRQKKVRRDGLSPSLGRALLPRNSLGDSRSDGQFKEFVPIRLNHEKYPEYKAHQADQHGKSGP
jgi:hypothetical protein